MRQINLESLNEEVKESLNIFIEKYIEDPNLHGILLTGSYAIGDASKNSDLDIFLIFKNLNWRERGNTWINGFEIEYFINPERQIHEYFRTEDPLRPNTAHMFANGIVLYSKPKSEILDNLINKAKKIIETPLDKMSEIEMELAKYTIDDLFKDLIDLNLEKNQIAYQLTAGDLLKNCLDIFFKMNRSVKEKNKRLPEQIESMDIEFSNIIKKVLKTHFELSEMERLVKYSESLINGGRTHEWKLRSDLRITEK